MNKLLILLLLVRLSSIFAAEVSFSPFLHLEGAAFQDDQNAYTQDHILSFIPGNQFELSSTYFSIYSKFAYRYDSFDAKRDTWFLGENTLSLQNADNDVVFTAGLQRVQLGTLDIFQGVDLINDSISDTFTQDINRQGYPIASLKFFTDSSKFSFFYLPYFFRPYYPPNSARMGFGLEFDQQVLVDADNRQYKSGTNFPQYGLKLDHSTENFDLSFSYFHLADRSLTFSFVDTNLLLTRYFFETDVFLTSLEGKFFLTYCKS